MSPIAQRALFTVIAVFSASAPALAGSTGAQKIETPNAVLTLKSGSGDLIGVEWKNPKLDLINEPRLGENFRILLPLPEYEPNYFNSRDQVVRNIDKTAHGVVLHYGPLKNARQEVNVNVSYEIRDTGSKLQFFIKVDNHTDLPLAEVFYGIVGGQQGIGSRLDTETHMSSAFLLNPAPKLFSQYPIYTEEDIGSGFDSASWDGASSRWLDVYNPKLSLGYYYANQDPTVREARLYSILSPHAKSVDNGDNWPSAELTHRMNVPRGLTLGWMNFPYTRQGTFQGGPVALQVHKGDWRVAAKLQRAWFDECYPGVFAKSSSRPTWLREQFAWQRLLMLGSQDEVLHRFSELPQLATEAKRYGVTAMEIMGWSVGGLERGYPEFGPDPRLGTVEDFRKALAAMRRIGVHPILFANLNLVDTTTEGYRTRWSKYQIQGRFGPFSGFEGYGHSTLGSRHYALGGPLRRNFAYVNPAHQELRHYEMNQYLDRAKDGAEAFHFEGADSISGMDFNTILHAPPDQSMQQAALSIFAELLQKGRQIDPQLSLSSISPREALLPYFDVNYGAASWGRDKDASSTAVLLTFPELAHGTITDRPEDYERLNNGLRYGLVWVMGSRQFTASLDDPLTRPLSRYLGELIRIRRQFSDVLFHAQFHDMPGANATVVEENPIASVVGDKNDIRYSMFEPLDKKNPRRAVVVVNFGDKAENATVNFPGKAGQKVTLSVPFQADRIALLPVSLTIPAHQAAVVVQ